MSDNPIIKQIEIDNQTYDFGVTIEAGTCTALAPGSTPTVENVGTIHEAIFNFGIPRGSKGDKGDPGDSTTEETVTVTAVDSVNTATIVPETNVIYTVPNTVASLIIDITNATWEYCTIKWSTGSTAPSLTVDSNSKWFGYDCASGVFTPVASAEYRIAVEKEGSTFSAYVFKLG